jgi:hypothetical protein
MVKFSTESGIFLGIPNKIFVLQNSTSIPFDVKKFLMFIHRILTWGQEQKRYKNYSDELLQKVQVSSTLSKNLDTILLVLRLRREILY